MFAFQPPIHCPPNPNQRERKRREGENNAASTPAIFALLPTCISSATYVTWTRAWGVGHEYGTQAHCSKFGHEYEYSLVYIWKLQFQVNLPTIFQ